MAHVSRNAVYPFVDLFSFPKYLSPYHCEFVLLTFINFLSGMTQLFSCVQESSEFHKRSFETAVASVKAIAASHLWQVTNAKR